jgi:hypothetical protein
MKNLFTFLSSSSAIGSGNLFYHEKEAQCKLYQGIETTDDKK